MSPSMRHRVTVSACRALYDSQREPYAVMPAGVVAAFVWFDHVGWPHIGDRVARGKIVGDRVPHDLPAGLEHALGDVQRAACLDLLHHIAEGGISNTSRDPISGKTSACRRFTT